MNVVRQDKATKTWVIYAPARDRRPRVIHLSGGKPKDALPAEDPNCPFCPGNENLLPGVILELPEGRGAAWQTRVVPNKFPALTPEEDAERLLKDLYLVMRGYGRHEVIIETPLHNQQPDRMPPERVDAVIETYHRRFVDLMNDSKNMMILLFRNHGEKAGTSLVHPHSQMIVTGFVPHYIRWREEEAQRHFDEWGRCVFCDILEFEGRDRKRVVLENDSFLAFVPYAAEVPYETWIMPKTHQASFEIGSGISINPSLPEEDAAFLRKDETHVQPESR